MTAAPEETTVLVADDDAQLLGLVSRRLKGMGFKVVEATAAKTADVYSAAKSLCLPSRHKGFRKRPGDGNGYVGQGLRTTGNADFDLTSRYGLRHTDNRLVGRGTGTGHRIGLYRGREAGA